MPKFFFDIAHEGDRITRDFTGADLPDLESAEIEALEIWKRLRREWESGASDPSEWSVSVMNAEGVLLAKMPSSLRFMRHL